MALASEVVDLQPNVTPAEGKNCFLAAALFRRTENCCNDNPHLSGNVMVMACPSWAPFITEAADRPGCTTKYMTEAKPIRQGTQRRNGSTV